MSDSHKRSKSSGVKSLLHRVASKNDRSNTSATESTPSEPDTNNGNLAASSASLSSQPSMSASKQSLHSRQASVKRPHLSTTMSNVGGQENLAPGATAGGQHSPVSPSAKGVSIEQSVKLFRVFEALRNGDTAAISKAINDQAQSGTGEEEGDGSSNTKLEGTSILHLAIQCAELPVIEYILSNAGEGRLDVNGRDREGNTPLHIAASLGRAPAVRLLLDRPDVNDSATNYAGQTPLDVARTPEIFQQLQLARSIFIDGTVKKIQALIAANDYDAVEKILVDSKVQSTLDVNQPDLATDTTTLETGGTLLHQAARKKDIKLIQLLLLNGADPFRRDRKGKLPQDVTKDDKTRAILKKSPAAAAAQRGIQEKTILGAAVPASGALPAEGGPGSKEAREMKGYLKKWTNYTSGYKLRWFVLEDGVMSYYKHQDDAGSACRGAINMKIARLNMDPSDKLRFEILGKSSVKYHLKANHQVEAKRWFWALNNAIQWSKDEAKEDERRQKTETAALNQAKIEQIDKLHVRDGDAASVTSSTSRLPQSRTPLSGATLAVPSATPSLQKPGSSVHTAEDDEYNTSAYDASVHGADPSRMTSHAGTNTADGDMDDEEEEFFDDASSLQEQPASRDAFNITAQSAKIQLDLLSQVAAGLKAESAKNPNLPLSDSTATQALASYDSAVGNLKALLGDLLRISRDRDAYWQYRLDREANVRRMWEESMAKVAREQEELQEKIGESELKRRKTKKALQKMLEGNNALDGSRPGSARGEVDDEKREAIASPNRRTTFADIEGISDSETEDEGEFFDAIDAGELEVVDLPPTSPGLDEKAAEPIPVQGQDEKAKTISTAFRGYEDGPRQKLAMDADDRPKISLWGILKSMIGKDMTKMTLPVSFNEPTSLLQRVAEDMEYTDLLDTAADRADSLERLVYVAAFAASEYASTIARVAKPFNPLLGETYEYARPDKGYRFFVEQVSHHPPIGAAHAESRKWEYYGESAVKSKFYGKSFDINPLGTWFLRLHPSHGDATDLYTWKKVTSSVIGIITGSPTVDNYGPMTITNHSTQETAYLDFKPRGWKASSAYQVAGKVCDARGNIVWSIGGYWNSQIFARRTPGYEDAGLGQAGGASKGNSKEAICVWRAHDRPKPGVIPFNLTPFCVTLNALPEKLRAVLPPTDTRLRPDQRAMEDGEYDFAATEKNRVEEKQRATRRRREEEGEEFKPRWFRKSRDETTGEEYWDFNRGGRGYWETRDKVARGESAWEKEGLEDIF